MHRCAVSARQLTEVQILFGERKNNLVIKWWCSRTRRNSEGVQQKDEQRNGSIRSVLYVPVVTHLCYITVIDWSLPKAVDYDLTCINQNNDTEAERVFFNETYTSFVGIEIKYTLMCTDEVSCVMYILTRGDQFYWVVINPIFFIDPSRFIIKWFPCIFLYACVLWCFRFLFELDNSGRKWS